MVQKYPDYTQKIGAIIEAIHLAKQLSANHSQATKLSTIGDAVYTHWELRHGGPDANCHPRSKNARRLSGGQLVVDWPIPRDFLAQQLFELPPIDLRVPLVQRMLYELAGFIFITKEEQYKLRQAGLATAFPSE